MTTTTKISHHCAHEDCGAEITGDSCPEHPEAEILSVPIADTTTLPRRPDPELFAEPAKRCRVRRDGDRDIAFRGWLLGEGSHSCGTGRDIEVRIWCTTLGRIITGSARRTSWQNETDRYAAGAHRTAAEALQWLRDDGGYGELGRASKTAWEAACDGGPLDGLDVEHADGGAA